MRKLAFFFGVNLLIVQAALGVTARELLLQAVEYTVNSRIESNGFNISELVMADVRELLKDGRKHHFCYQAKPHVWVHYVYNEELGPGQFEWKSETREGKPPGGKIIHTKYCQVYELLVPLDGLVEMERFESGECSMTDGGSYRGIPCYKLTIRYPDSDEVISTTSLYNFDPNYVYCWLQENQNFASDNYHVTKELFTLKKSELFEKYFARVQLLVDKTPGRPFIYAMEAFNRNGKKIYSEDWGNVRFLEQIDPGEFQLPGSKIIPVGTHKEWARQNRINFRKLYTKHEPGWLSQIFQPLWNGSNQNIGAMLIWGGRIAFWLAVAAIVLAVILKLRAKK